MPELYELNGLITEEVGIALYELAMTIPGDQAIVELGSFRGKSTAYLAAGARDGNSPRVYAVDPWDLPGNIAGKHNYSDPSVREDFEKQLRSVRVWSRVTPIQNFSRNAAAEWSGPKIGLLYVDANHDAESVMNDFVVWERHLATEQLVAFDDLDTPRNPGVRQVIDQLVRRGFDLEVQAERLAILRRNIPYG